MGKYFASSNRRNEADRALCEKIEETYGYTEEQVDDFPIKYWRAIDNLCSYWEKYHELSWTYTDDLLLYAMMYRNVIIGDRYNNIFDKKFFVEREEQIIGFKQKIFESDYCTPRIIILKLYYEFGPSFEELSYKLTGKSIYFADTTEYIIFSNRDQSLTKSVSKFDIKGISHLNNLLNGNLDKVMSINDFTDEECQTIIEHKSELSTSFWREMYISKMFKNLKNRTGEEVDYRLYWKENQEKIIKRWHSSLIRNWVGIIRPILEQEEEKERKRQEEEERRRREAEEKRLEQYRFNIRNQHWRDCNVSFRKADHIYIVDGTPLDSVTTFVKNCFPEFNSEFHAKRKAEALGITKEEVLEMWDKKGRESREQGTTMHEKIESYYLGKSVSTDTTFELFKIFANKITLKPFRTEWAVYDWDQKIAGTIDFVDYQNGEYIIYDWKRSDKLIAKNGLPIKNSQYGVKALPPIENLDDSPYYHYALQLSLYKYILEKNYGITVSKLRLGIFHPSYNKPYVLEIPYLQNEIDALFRLRSEVIF
jgi:hypothetical protein